MQLSKNCRSFNATGKIFVKKLVGAGGFEPPTLRLSSACSNQLSYTPECSGAWVPSPHVAVAKIDWCDNVDAMIRPLTRDLRPGLSAWRVPVYSLERR